MGGPVHEGWAGGARCIGKSFLISISNGQRLHEVEGERLTQTTRRQVSKGGGGLLCQFVVGEGVGVGALPVEPLLGELGGALFLVGFAVVLALLALA